MILIIQFRVLGSSSRLQILTNVNLFRAPMEEHALMELTISHVSAFQATPEIDAKLVIFAFLSYLI